MASCEAPRLRAPRSVPRWWPSPTSRPSPPASPRAHAPRSAPPPAARPARTPSTCGRAWPSQATQATQPPQTPQTPQTPQPPPTPQATQCGAHLRVDGRRLDQPAGIGAGAQLQLRSGGHEQPVLATGRRHAGVNAEASQHTAQAHLLPVAAKAEAVLDLVAQRHRQTGLLLQHPSSATPCTQHAMGVRVAAHLAPADGDAPCQALALQPRAHAGQASGTRDHAWQPQGRRRRHTCTAKGLVGRHRSSSACPGVSILNIS
eukprot:SAG25_NODE_118_length_14760_cov_873.663666_10_plen_260_part_00